MKVDHLRLEGLRLLQPQRFDDDRGYFFESFNQSVFDAAIGRPTVFVQDNHTRSKRGVLRGLHFQCAPQEQAKLIRVVHGEIFDVVVDIREKSPTFGEWLGTYLSAENQQQLWIPEGFAHGFLVVSDWAEVLYKTTAFWSTDCERTIAWNCPNLRIQWPINTLPILSSKDANAAGFIQAFMPSSGEDR